MSFIPVFAGQPISPSNQNYRELDFSADVTLTWGLEQDATGEAIASQIDLSPAGAGLSVILPSGLQGSNGASVLFYNRGADTVTIKDAALGTVCSVASGEAWYIYLQDNATVAGVWTTFQFGAGVSVANAASLAGAGLTAIGATLNQEMVIQSKSANYPAVANDRATMLMWTSGVGTFTLPDPTTVGADWFVAIKNSGSGTLTINTAAGLIDGTATSQLSTSESFIVITDGTDYYTLGFGQSANSQFDFISISIAGGAGNYTLAGVELNRIAYDLTGVITGNRNVIVPASVQQYWIQNNTTGAFTVTVKTAAGVGVEVPQGNSAILFCDGTDVINAADSASITLPLTIGQGGTGQVTAAAALAALGGVPTTRTVSAGAGLSGGGNLSSDRTLALSFLGLEALTDPGADRIMFWDESANALAWLTPGAGLAVDTTTLRASVYHTYKTATTDRASTTTLTADPDLVFTNLPTGYYEFELLIRWAQNSGASQGIVFDFDSTGLTAFGMVAYAINTAPISNFSAASTRGDSITTDFTLNLGAGAGDAYILVKGSVSITSGTNTFNFRWAQSVSNAAWTSVKQGSFAKLTRMGA
jgi:hypothetical protein